MTAPDLSPAELAFLDRPYAPESLVERVAKAMCDGDSADFGWLPWGYVNEEVRDDYRLSAQHAIDAMKGEPL